VSCARTAEAIDLPFGLWTPVGRRMHKFNRIRGGANVPSCQDTLPPPGILNSGEIESETTMTHERINLGPI